MYIHGYSKTPIYLVWCAMHRRCRNKQDRCYDMYGKRGISVAPRWNKFVNFLKDMGPCPKGMSLERIDNSKGYSKGNCQWATPSEQARNTRRNVWLTACGRTQLACDWAKELKMPQGNLHRSIHKGMSLEQIIEMRMVNLAKRNVH